MMKLLNGLKGSLLLSCLLLAACDTQEHNYNCLMTHPKLLEKAIRECETVISTKCTLVARAANDFSILLNQRRENPEEFGNSIMQAQYELTDLRKQVLTTPPSSKRQSLQTDLLAKTQQLQVYMAVVSATSNVG
jgi:hypothetical protein